MNDLVPFSQDDPTELIAAGGFLTTYPTDTPDGKRLTARAVIASDVALDDIVGKTIEIVNCVAHAVRMADRETGEMRGAVRTVFVGPDGTRYSTTSPYPLPSLQTSCQIMGVAPPFAPPLKVLVSKVRRRKGDGGYLQLEVVG